MILSYDAVMQCAHPEITPTITHHQTTLQITHNSPHNIPPQFYFKITDPTNTSLLIAFQTANYLNYTIVTSTIHRIVPSILKGSETIRKPFPDNLAAAKSIEYCPLSEMNVLYSFLLYLLSFVSCIFPFSPVPI